MFAAGVTNNFAITIVVFALLFGPIAGAMAVAPGAAVGGVEPESTGADAGIEPGDRITAVDGHPSRTTTSSGNASRPPVRIRSRSNSMANERSRSSGR